MGANEKTPRRKRLKRRNTPNAREPGSTSNRGAYTSNHNTPGPSPFNYFPPGSVLSQVLLVLVAAIAFNDFQKNGAGPTTKSRLQKPVSRELKEKGHLHSGVAFCTALEI